MRAANNTGLNTSKTIYDAIQQIAGHSIMNPRTNTPYNSGMVSGYVAKIHSDPNDELYGTIDVKEWNCLVGDESDITLEGYHKGVRLNAIQDSNKGIVIIPKLYSDVILSKDAEGGNEYVTMYSHVDVIQLDSHESIVVGVKERKEYDNSSEDSPDIDELELTGVSAQTTYKKDVITTEVVDEEGSKKVVYTIDLNSIGYDIADGATKYTATEDKVTLERDNASSVIKSGEIQLKVGSEIIKLNANGVFLGADSGTSHAVLGEELGNILGNILNLISQIKTTTQLGPQPPLNLASFIALKAQVNAWTSSVSNFLTQKVNIQK